MAAKDDEKVWSVAGARRLAAKYVAGQGVRVVIKAVDSVKRAPEMIEALQAIRDDGCEILYDDFVFHLCDVDAIFAKYIVALDKIIKAAPKVRVISKARVGELLAAYDELMELQVPVDGECMIQYRARPQHRARRQFGRLPLLRFFGIPLKRKSRKGKGRRGKASKAKKENKKKSLVSVVSGLAQRMHSLALKLLFAKKFNADLAKIVRSVLFGMTLFRNRRALFDRVKISK